ncbi:uncharacterized protein DUF4437 [Nitrospirillum amazonense]|uniref:Uncharacterized protein DUF4437 n=1 Tax=Nitrospirillum amazonense TaxID=28077 RepID=A0A560FFI6_9PROT|nr:DUF4437 domain-containing protein [Nitrospirillum amazonense]TWB20359.1 uncharacterized protein DUF4437 [Nitrospirillum amazonense]
MARSWIEFIQAQYIPWQPHTLWGLRDGVEAKVLSHDDATGAVSMLVRYPAGFTAPASRLVVDEEFLVLDGTLTMAGQEYGHLAYAHLPAGYERGGLDSPGGAVVLTFLSAAPDRAVPVTGYDPARLVARLDGYQVPYTGNFHPEFPPGAGRKLLYKDPVTGDVSWMLGTLPVRWAERSEVHPTVEEMYLLSGEVHGNRGVMRPGAYFWRPPEAPHGPYGTLTGNLYFFRTKGGPLTTNYVQAERPFQWWPAYDPVLPPDMEAYRGEMPANPTAW